MSIKIFEDSHVYRAHHGNENIYVFKNGGPHIWINNRLITFDSWDCVEHSDFPDWIKEAVREIRGRI